MGLILDSSVLISAERKGKNARQALVEVAQSCPGEEVAISVVTAMELTHGAVRADSPVRRTIRRKFLDELLSALPVHPVTVPIALRAGQIDGESAGRGVRVPLADLLIAVTALHLDHVVLTNNRRHFEMVPGVTIAGFHQR